jgi:hypothetical protein
VVPEGSAVGDEQVLAQNVQPTGKLLPIVRQQLCARPVPRHTPRNASATLSVHSLLGSAPHLALLAEVLNPDKHEPFLASGGD